MLLLRIMQSATHAQGEKYIWVPLLYKLKEHDHVSKPARLATERLTKLNSLKHPRSLSSMHPPFYTYNTHVYSLCQ